MNRYRINLNGEERGPYTFEQLRSMWSSGYITADTLYWQEGMAEWEPIEKLQLDLPVQPVSRSQPSTSLQRIPPSSHYVHHTGRITTKARGSIFVAIGALMCFTGVILLFTSVGGVGTMLLVLGFVLAVVGRMMS
jgi:hypothetical protein